MTRWPRPVVLLMVLAASTAGTSLGYDSKCYTDEGLVCEEGYAPPRSRMRPPAGCATCPPPEHAVVWDAAFAVSGLDPSLAAPFVLRNFSSDADLGTGGFRSVAPVLNGAQAAVRRTTTIGEMAQLPDFSWSLWDWAQGNETCPAFADVSAEDCHSFRTHMGALNSSHFPPQSRTFYEHYHQLALARAADCTTLAGAVSSVADRMDPWVLACEKEALLLEAIGQHYLQDAWSMGHMWERWGGPEISDFGGDRGLALAVGAVSGMVHGARAILDDLIDDLIGWSPPVPVTDDPMCAPHPDVDFVASGGTAAFDGAGDYYFLPYIAVQSAYDVQYDTMVGCAVDGMRAVYGATAMRHGTMGWPSNVNQSLSVLSDACWGQRATNQALATGWGVHIGPSPNQQPLITARDTLMLMAVVQFATGSGGAGLLSPATQGTLSRDVSWNGALVLARARQDPAGTASASAGLLPLAGIDVNSQYGGTAAAPASYSEPALPWRIDQTDPEGPRKQLLNLAFADAHAADRCQDLSGDELAGYVSAATSALASNAPNAAALCSQCVQMIAPHLRVGADASDYDATREPLCNYTNPGSAMTYSGDVRPTGSLTSVARSVCGCGRLLVTSRTSFSGGLALFDSAGEEVEHIAVGSGAPGDLLPAQGGLRDVAVGGPLGAFAYATSADGALHVYALSGGGETEIDQDDDANTTTAGAPQGISRLALGIEPRGAALAHTTPHLLIATQTELLVIDPEPPMTIVSALNATALGLESNERPYDIAITPDDRRAYVTLYGNGFNQVASRVLALDLPAILAGNLTPAVVVASIDTGADTNNQLLAMSNDGTRLAVTCPNTNRIALIDTATDALWDINLSTPTFNDQFYVDLSHEPSNTPTAVAWSPDDSAIYAGYASGPNGSSLSGAGTVRKCVMGDPDCWHAVGVGGAVRALDVRGAGAAQMVYVGDASGGITPLAASLFEADASTTGVDNDGYEDGTGGCLSNFGGFNRAEPCPPAAILGLNPPYDPENPGSQAVNALQVGVLIAL